MRKLTATTTAALLAITPLIAASPAAALATDDATTAMPVEDEDNDFPWGLLGLLGLAGLMGKKRRDDDVHVNRTGTGGTSDRP